MKTERFKQQLDEALRGQRPAKVEPRPEMPGSEGSRSEPKASLTYERVRFRTDAATVTDGELILKISVVSSHGSIYKKQRLRGPHPNDLPIIKDKAEQLLRTRARELKDEDETEEEIRALLAVVE